jgi:ABC-type antimicrobial peptide transport system permease subunit
LIVGIVADLGTDRADAAYPGDVIYNPFPVAHTSGGFIIVRGRSGTKHLRSAIDHAVARADPRVAALDHETYTEQRAVVTWVERRLAQLFSLFGAVSLLLAAFGLYAVLSLWVRQRETEFGIRLAIGALPRQIGGLALRSGARAVAWGALLGAAGAAIGLRFLEPFLYKVEIWHAPTFVAVLATLLVTGLAASIGPSSRAATVDPVDQLRREA